MATACGPLVDDGAEYSAIRKVKLLEFFEIWNDCEIDLSPIPDMQDETIHWQSGIGKYAVTTYTLGSTMIVFNAD